MAEIVERWIPGANVRRDLFNFIDILAVRDGEVVGVQTTSASNVASRARKIAEAETVDVVRKAGIRIVVHGWAKRKGRWTLREVDCS